MTKIKTATRRQVAVGASLLRQKRKLKEQVKESEQSQVQIEDGRGYLLVFNSIQAEAEGNYVMSGMGLLQGIKIGDKHVSIVKGYQVRELERLKIPYEIFTTKPNRNGNHKAELRK